MFTIDPHLAAEAVDLRYAGALKVARSDQDEFGPIWCYSAHRYWSAQVESTVERWKQPRGATLLLRTLADSGAVWTSIDRDRGEG